MLKAVGLFGRKKNTRQFKDFYAEWFSDLKTTLLPSLQSAMSESDSSLTRLSTQVDALHRHFQSYYDALDLAAAHDVAQLLYPAWRNPLEKPFLFLGDLHPYLFTNLLRSFLTGADSDDDEIDCEKRTAVQMDREIDIFDRPWHIATAWRSPSNDLMSRVEQIDRGMRLMVPALVARARDAQAGFLERVGRNWAYGGGAGNKEAVAEAMAEQNEEMVGVFVDANRIRKSVLVDIMGGTSVYQSALFLEGLAQFLVGFRDSELIAKLEMCKTPLSKQVRLAI